MITVNGRSVALALPMTLGEYVDEHQYKRNRIAVELNGQILPKSRYNEVTLREGDILEIVSFVGGG